VEKQIYEISVGSSEAPELGPFATLSLAALPLIVDELRLRDGLLQIVMLLSLGPSE